ncbi:hypothetical protein BGM26_19805, partial [Bacillus sp. FJAT-29790]|nr:hypothetical protein [Bacillus sp. FJAT-29790]
MQVNYQPSHHQLPISESPLEIKQGEVYQASIKEKRSATEAVLHIRGKEIFAKFEDGVPSENRVTILVNGQKDQLVNVKTIATENVKMDSQLSSEEKVLNSIGITGKENGSLQKAAQILLDKGAPLSKEVVNELKEFMDKAKGPVDSKIETVKALANKRLEATQTQLRAIHEALHGKPLNEVLTAIAKEIDPEFKLAKKEVSSGAQQNQKVRPQSSPVVGAHQLEGKGSNPVATDNGKQSISEGPKSIDSQLSEVVRKSRELIQKEPDLRKAIQQIKEEIVHNPKIDRELSQKIEKATVEAEKLQSIGKDRLIQALKNAEAQLLKKEQQAIQSNVPADQSRGTNASHSQDVKLANLVKELTVEVSKDPNIQRSIEKVRDQIIDNSRFPKEMVEKVSRAVNEAANLVKQGRITTGKDVLSSALSDLQRNVEKAEVRGSLPVNIEQQKATASPSQIVKQVSDEVQREPSLLRAVEKVREQIVQHPKMDREVVQKVEKALNEAIQLQKIGQESAGRERIQQALVKAETDLKQLESRQPSQNPVDRSINEPRQSEIVKEARAEIRLEPNLPRAIEKVREQIVQNPKMDREVAQKVEKALNEVNQLQKVGKESSGRERLQQALAKAELELKQIEPRQSAQLTQASQADRSTNETRPSEIVKEARAEVQREPNLPHAIEKVREQIVQNPKMDREVAQKVEKALSEAIQLQKIGQESAGRDRLQQVLAKAELEQKQLESRQSAQPTQAFQSDRSTNETRPNEIVRETKVEVQREPNLSRAIEKVREQIVQSPKIDREVAQKVEKALSEVAQLQKIGQESLGRDRLLQVL